MSYVLTKAIEQSKINHFAKWMGRAGKIVIVAHAGLDGDTIGFSLGLWHFFSTQDEDVNIIVPNAFPDFLRWMPGNKDILSYDRCKEFVGRLIAETDVICCLDFDVISRTDTTAEAVSASSTHKVLTDHHLNPEDLCRIIIPHFEISLTSELVFRLICRTGYFDDTMKSGVERIYTGMITGMGGLTHNSGNREICFITNELLSRGIGKGDTYRKAYNTYSESRLRLMGHALSQMKVYPDHRAALITPIKKEQGHLNHIRGDSEEFVNIPLSIESAVFSCFLHRDTEEPMIRVSLRLVGSFSCSRLVAESSNGDGYLNASGEEFHGALEKTKKVLKLVLEKFKPLLNAKG